MYNDYNYDYDDDYIYDYDPNDELYHFGVKGMKWGVRRYQNEDGSPTAAGRGRYSKKGINWKKAAAIGAGVAGAAGAGYLAYRNRAAIGAAAGRMNERYQKFKFNRQLAAARRSKYSKPASEMMKTLAKNGRPVGRQGVLKRIGGKMSSIRRNAGYQAWNIPASAKKGLSNAGITARRAGTNLVKKGKAAYYHAKSARPGYGTNAMVNYYKKKNLAKRALKSRAIARSVSRLGY